MNALDAARAVLPAWVVWAPLAGIPLSLALSSAVAGGLLLWGRRRLAAIPADAHWPERARLAWPMRVAARLLVLLVPAACAALALGGDLSRPPRAVAIGLAVLAAAAPMLAAAFTIEDLAVRPARAPDRLRSLGVYLVCWYPTLTISLAYLALRAWDGPSPLELVAVCAVLPLVGLGSAGLRVGGLLGLARPAPERAVRALARACERAGRPVPPLLELRMVGANAFALPLGGVVGVTSGALAHLDDDALAALFAHELAHLAEPARTKVVRWLAGSGAAALIVVLPSLRFASLPVLGATLAAVLALLAVLRRAARVVRAAEASADLGARDGGAEYARALELGYRANLAPAVLRRRGAHPHLYDRLVAAGATPAWPRPEPPPRGTPVVLGCALVAVVLLWGVLTTRRAAAEAARSDAALLVAVAVQQDAAHVTRLAAVRAARGEVAAASPLYRAAVLLDPAGPDALLAGAGAQALRGHCALAGTLLQLATARGADRGAAAAIQRALASCAERPDDAARP